jgi:hypothetical protein
MSYFCEHCNYKTDYSSNFCIHKKSKKHIAIVAQKKSTDSKNIAQYSSNIALCSSNIAGESYTKTIANLYCENCKNNFKHSSSFYRHKKNCKNNNIEDTQLKSKILILEKENEMLKKIEKEKSELLNNFMENANTLLNKAHDNTKITAEAIKSVSMSALKYANENYKEAPILLPLEDFTINNLSLDKLEDRGSIIETLIYNAKQKSLDKLLGEHIIKNYKKDDPKKQSFHTTDCSRLNYLVRELFQNAITWEIDKSGIKICSVIIKPLIEKCINILLEHQKDLLKEMANGNYSKQVDVQLIIDVIMSIDKGSLENDINKYIAPHFNINKKIK